MTEMEGDSVNELIKPQKLHHWWFSKLPGDEKKIRLQWNTILSNLDVPKQWTTCKSGRSLRTEFWPQQQLTPPTEISVSSVLIQGQSRILSI